MGERTAAEGRWKPILGVRRIKTDSVPFDLLFRQTRTRKKKLKHSADVLRNDYDDKCLLVNTENIVVACMKNRYDIAH